MNRDAAGGAQRSLRLAVFGSCALVGVIVLAALGIWQLERRAWKLELISRVERRIHAAPVAAPGPAPGPVSAAAEEYRHVSATGRFDNGHETLVRAATQLGSGFWVMTPFRTREGFTVLVNRGFVPPERRDPASRVDGLITGETVVTGLVRMSEPKGGFLQANDPSADRWYSRDVAAIAAARQLSGVVPYFIDADAAAAAGRLPVGGLTVVAFPNNHLVYALTWFALALMLTGAAVRVVREERRTGVRPRTQGTEAFARRPRRAQAARCREPDGTAPMSEKAHAARLAPNAEAATAALPHGNEAALPPAEGTANRKNMMLLIQLRWIAVMGQVATIAVVQLGLEVPLPARADGGGARRARAAQSREPRMAAPRLGGEQPWTAHGAHARCARSDRSALSERGGRQPLYLSVSAAGGSRRRPSRCRIHLGCGRPELRRLRGAHGLSSPAPARSSRVRPVRPAHRGHAHLLRLGCRAASRLRDANHAQSARARRARGRPEAARRGGRSHRPHGPAGVGRRPRARNTARLIVGDLERLAPRPLAPRLHRTTAGNRRNAGCGTTLQIDRHRHPAVLRRGTRRGTCRDHPSTPSSTSSSTNGAPAGRPRCCTRTRSGRIFPSFPIPL